MWTVDQTDFLLLLDGSGQPFTAFLDALIRAHGFVFGVPEPERFLSELARRLYAFPDGDSLENAPRLVRLTQILAALARLEEAQAKFPVASGRVSLALAASRQDRSRLEDLLDVVGFRLIRRADRYQVERSDDREAAARARLLSDLGLDLDDFASRLNAGEAIAPEIPGEMVPVPLPLRVWTDTIFAGTVPPDRLFAAIASDRRTALAAHGFAALDDPTLLYPAASPAIVRSLVDRHAGGLAAFGRSLRLLEGHLVLPGGVEALALWEELVGQRSSDPARFIDALFGRDDCRLAWFHDSIAQLAPAQQRYALGPWLPAPSRAARSRALYDAFAGSYRAEWQPSQRRFIRSGRAGQKTRRARSSGRCS